MEKVSRKVVRWLLSKKVIEREETEIYEFGVLQILTNIVDTTVILIAGMWFKQLISTVYFLISFSMLRRYSGGYHAKTVERCLVTTLLFGVSAVCLMAYVDMPAWIEFSIWGMSDIIILNYAPVHNNIKILDEIEQIVYRRRALAVWFVESFIMIVMFVLGMKQPYEGVWMSHVCVMLAMLMGMNNLRKEKKQKGECVK